MKSECLMSQAKQMVATGGSGLTELRDPRAGVDAGF
jgi:hypothetical protein